jgi:hypothetical protein
MRIVVPALLTLSLLETGSVDDNLLSLVTTLNLLALPLPTIDRRSDSSIRWRRDARPVEQSRTEGGNLGSCWSLEVGELLLESEDAALGRDEVGGRRVGRGRRGRVLSGGGGEGLVIVFVGGPRVVEDYKEECVGS